jgi:hypothetical protein
MLVEAPFFVLIRYFIDFARISGIDGRKHTVLQDQVKK